VILETVAVVALVTAWAGAGHVDRVAPVRAGISGAARASVTTGWAVGRARWSAGADARAGRRAERMAHWHWRAGYRATSPVRAAGRGIAVTAPAVVAGARAARGGWVAGYRAEKDRRAGIGPGPGAVETGARGSVGPDVTAPAGPEPIEAPGPGDPGPAPEGPAPAGPTLTVVPDTNGDTPVATAPTGTEITDLTVLSAVLADMERLAEEMQSVSHAAKETHLLAACEFPFDPGRSVRAALNAASEIAPQWFDADAWHAQLAAARQAVDALQQQATELTDTGASGHTDQLAAS
jgi:hypothetical protein